MARLTSPIGSAGLAAAVFAILLAGCGGSSPSPNHGASPHPRTPGSPAGPVSPAPSLSGFLAASVTFVSTQDGWVLGTIPCGASTCLAIARTRDGGHTWTSVSPPPTSYSQTPLAQGVDAIRFANTLNGWAFGPQLWATHNGGATWTRISLPGWSSADFEGLETAAGTVHAVFLATSGVPAIRIATSPVASNSWQVSPTTVPIGAGPVPDPQIVLQGGVGWVLEVDRTVIGGARLVSGQWESWQPPCSQVNGPASLAASSAQDLIAVCDQGVWGPATPSGERVWVSSDGGGSFSLLSTPPSITSGASNGPIASPSSMVAALGDGASILATFNGGASWSKVYTGSGGIQYVGFTTPSQGVAIAGNPTGNLGSLLMTVDGGHDWAAVPI